MNEFLAYQIPSSHSDTRVTLFFRYLPGVKLPKNLKAIPDVREAAQDADILLFVLPHQASCDRSSEEAVCTDDLQVCLQDLRVAARRHFGPMHWYNADERSRFPRK